MAAGFSQGRERAQQPAWQEPSPVRSHRKQRPALYGGEEGLLEILGAGQEAPEGAWEGAQDVGPIAPGGEGGLACGEELW